MADVRSLLRQQQASRRITHPHALYTDSGRLSCALCREPVKTEALWETHTRSAQHRQRLQALSAARQRERDEAQDKENLPSAGAGKRKFDDDEDGGHDFEEGRRKRSRPDVDSPMSGTEASGDGNLKEVRTPSSGNRASNTPVQGVEMNIPSRPATPMHRESTSSTTSNAPGDPPAFPFPLSKTTPAPPKAQQLSQPQQTQTQPQTSAQVDEAEWAAFEADIAATTAPYAEDAVISAPAVPAAGRTDGEDGEGDGDDKETQKGRVDKEMEAEREDAARAIEVEFEEMEELEARAKRLRERREALRARAAGQYAGPASAAENGDGKGPVAAGKENAAAGAEDEDEDDDDEEDDYTWGGLRYAGRA